MSDNLIQNDSQLDLATRALATMEKQEQKSETSMERLENTLIDFTKASMALTIESNHLTEVLEKDFEEGIKDGSLSNTEKITIYNIKKAADNDRTFKIMSTSFGVISNKQQAEIQAAARRDEQVANQTQININTGNSKDAEVASSVSAAVINGSNAWSGLLSALEDRARRRAAEKNNAVEVEAEVKDE